jgi:signal transduction histidine kinase
MNGAALERHHIKIIREYSEVPNIVLERHKVLQILINLLRNAKYACDEVKRPDKRITLRLAIHDGDKVRIMVIDNGIGIPPENLTRIFEHGFTTRKEGHGFGLHSGALAAREMGGSLTVQSAGLEQGANFILEFPCSHGRTTT